MARLRKEKIENKVHPEKENNLEVELNSLSLELNRQNTFRGILAFTMRDYYRYLLSGIINLNLSPIILQTLQDQMRQKIGEINTHFQKKPSDFDDYSTYYQSQDLELTNQEVDAQIKEVVIKFYEMLQKFLENEKVEEIIRKEYLGQKLEEDSV